MFGAVISVWKLSGRTERVDGVFLMVGVVVTVHIDEGLLSHPEETCRLPSRNAALRQPRRAGVAQRVWDDVVAKTGRTPHRAEGLVYPFNRLAVPLDNGAD